MNAQRTQTLSHKIACKSGIHTMVMEASRELSRMRTADQETDRLRRAWAKPENLHALVTAGFLDNWLQKAKDLLPKDILKAWSKVSGILKRFLGIFKNPRAVKALSHIIGDITPDKIKDFLKEGARQVKHVFSQIKAVLTTPSGLPTLTDLIKRTAIGANIADWFNANVKPKADIVDEFLKKHVPTLRKVGLAAAFAFIWLNVDELSWEMSALVEGFTGQLSLADLLATLPESAIGALSSSLFGIGYTIMPYMLLGRILWMVGRKYLVWDGKSFKVNWNLVDKVRFQEAHKSPEYRMAWG